MSLLCVFDLLEYLLHKLTCILFISWFEDPKPVIIF